MKTTMKSPGREFLLDGLTELLAQTRLAILHEKKAFLPIARAEKQLELVQEAAKTVPAADGETVTWDGPGELVPVYRDALVILGFKLEKLRKTEIELKVDPTKTKQKMNAIQEHLKELGDQRDLFSMIEEQNRKAERAAKGSTPDPAQTDFLEGDGVDGKGTRPPKAVDITPIRSRVDKPGRAAASPAPPELEQ
jgi:hypothetical protein